MTRWTKKAWLRATKVAKILMLVLFSILIITPLRDIILFPVLPPAWRTHSSFRLVRMLMDNQHFPIENPLSRGDANSPIQVEVLSVENFLEKEDPFQEFQEQKQLLEDRAKHDSNAAGELALMNSFQPAMSLTERAQLLYTFDVFVKTCQKYNLTFFIFEGSLLGSYRFHGLIPWDDDIDIAMNGSQWREIKHVLGNIPDFTLFASPDSQWKFFMSDLPAFHDKPFKWPNLDIFFFSEHDSHVWGLTWGVKNHLIMHTKYLLPLSTVKWERWQLPAPACAERFLTINYDLSKCVTPNYIHKTDKAIFNFQTEEVDCLRLHKYFPFVFRHRNSTSGWAEERRGIGDRVLQTVNVPPAAKVCLD